MKFSKLFNSSKNDVFRIWLFKVFFGFNLEILLVCHFRHLELAARSEQLAARSARTNNFDTEGVRTTNPQTTRPR